MKKTLCLDLNNILVDIFIYKDEEADAILKISEDEFISIKIKPYTMNFLSDMKSKYELILYSTLNFKYVQAISDYLEKDEKYFAYRFDESFCLFANVFTGVKFINFLCYNRTLSSILILDLSVKTFPLNPYNVVAIPPNTLSSNLVLAKLSKVLDLFVNELDVQIALRRFIEFSRQ